MADTQNIIAPVGVSSTPSIASAATALEANKARGGWLIQNLGTNVLFVRFGAGASTTVFNIALKASTGNDDGLGGLYEQHNGAVFTGLVSIAGTSPRYVATEITA